MDRPGTLLLVTPLLTDLEYIEPPSDLTLSRVANHSKAPRAGEFFGCDGRGGACARVGSTRYACARTRPGKGRPFK